MRTRAGEHQLFWGGDLREPEDGWAGGGRERYSCPYAEKYNRRATEKRLGRAKAKMEELRYLLKIELDDDEAYIVV